MARPGRTHKRATYTRPSMFELAKPSRHIPKLAYAYAGILVALTLTGAVILIAKLVHS